MARIINAQKSFRIGLPVAEFSSDFPEFQKDSIKSLPGSNLIEMGCTTWEQFFKTNPLKLLVSKIYMVYEIDDDGNFGKYAAEGQFQPYRAAAALGDKMQDEAAVQPIYKRENTRLQNEVERLLERQDQLNEIIVQKNKQIADLQAAEQKWWKDERGPLMQEIQELKYKIEKIEADNVVKIQSLNDDFESQKNAAVEALRNEELAKKNEELAKKHEELEKAERDRKETLSGYGEIATAVAVPIFGKIMDGVLASLHKNYPNLIPSIAEKLGGDATPSPALAQTAPAQTQTLDPSTAFQVGQGQTTF